MLPPLSPPAAYREDLARPRGRGTVGARDTFGPHDGLWLALGCFLERLALLAAAARGGFVECHGRTFEHALGRGAAARLPDEALARLAELRAALGATPERLAATRAARVVQALAAEMEAAGAHRLAYCVLWSVGSALPDVDADVACAVLLQRAQVAEKLGVRQTAHALYAAAYRDAAQAALPHLVAAARRGKSRTSARSAAPADAHVPPSVDESARL